MTVQFYTHSFEEIPPTEYEFKTRMTYHFETLFVYESDL